jgi:hypothetical protein
VDRADDCLPHAAVLGADFGSGRAKPGFASATPTAVSHSVQRARPLLLGEEGKIVRCTERKPSSRPTIFDARPATFFSVNE